MMRHVPSFGSNDPFGKILNYYFVWLIAYFYRLYVGTVCTGTIQAVEFNISSCIFQMG
jgi:hypothetical protein